MAERMTPEELDAIRERNDWLIGKVTNRFRPSQTEQDRAALLRHAEALEQENDRLRQERYDALSVYTKEGLLASEWIARTGKAERERNEAQEKTKALEQEINSRCEHCGAKVYSGPPDCPMCGAPNCCPQCCQIDHLKQEVERLRGIITDKNHEWAEDQKELWRLRQQIERHESAIASYRADRDSAERKLARLEGRVTAFSDHMRNAGRSDLADRILKEVLAREAKATGEGK